MTQESSTTNENAKPAASQLSEAADSNRETPLPGPKLVTDVRSLEPRLRERVAEILSQGGTIEHAVEVVENESEGKCRVTAGAVEMFFATSAGLEKARTEHLLKRMDELKRGMKDPASLEARMADAAMMTGLHMLSATGRRISAKDAATRFAQRRYFAAKKELCDIKVKRQQKEEALMDLRIEQIRQRNELLREQVKQLRQFIERDGRDLGPELMRHIHQIYGLAHLPDIPAMSVKEEW